MAKTPPKLKSDRDYKGMMRRLRGKVSFNYDLRKKLTTGQKSAIRRAFKDIPQTPGIRFAKPPRKPGESSKNYARRLNTIKKSVGQENTPFNGVFIQTSSKAKISFRNNQVNIRIPEKDYSEKFEPLNRELFATDALRPPYLMAIAQKADNQGYNKIMLLFGLYRGLNEYDTDDPEFFADQIEFMINKYGADKKSEFENKIIGGFIFIRRKE